MADRHEDEAQYCIQHQYLSGEKQRIDEAEAQQQKQPPHVAVLEIFAPLCRTVALQIKSEAKQQSKDGIRLSGERKEQKIPQRSVERFHER